jgi:hypothetical protein
LAANAKTNLTPEPDAPNIEKRKKLYEGFKRTSNFGSDKVIICISRQLSGF